MKIQIFLILPTIMILRAHGTNLIEATCKNTPNYQLCVTTLRANPGSAAADVAGLGLIVVGAVKAKTEEALSSINKLIRSSPPKLSQALNKCIDVYNAVLKADVPEAEASVRGNPKFAENGMADTVVEANTCDGAFKGMAAPRPVTSVNKVVRDLAGVARAIIRNLL